MEKFNTIQAETVTVSTVTAKAKVATSNRMTRQVNKTEEKVMRVLEMETRCIMCGENEANSKVAEGYCGWCVSETLSSVAEGEKMVDLKEKPKVKVTKVSRENLDKMKTVSKRYISTAKGIADGAMVKLYSTMWKALGYTNQQTAKAQIPVWTVFESKDGQNFSLSIRKPMATVNDVITAKLPKALGEHFLLIDKGSFWNIYLNKKSIFQLEDVKVEYAPEWVQATYSMLRSLSVELGSDCSDVYKLNKFIDDGFISFRPLGSLASSDDDNTKLRVDLLAALDKELLNKDDVEVRVDNMETGTGTRDFDQRICGGYDSWEVIVKIDDLKPLESSIYEVMSQQYGKVGEAYVRMDSKKNGKSMAWGMLYGAQEMDGSLGFVTLERVDTERERRSYGIQMDCEQFILKNELTEDEQLDLLESFEF